MNDIDRIKDLLFGHEKKALDAITRRLEIPESRTADIADVLPEALLRSHASDPRLVRALEEPVEQCIKSSIRRDPHDFADALFPVIGPAIRKAIADALRSMTQSLNQAIEKSFSIRTRFEAWRAGVPLGEYILQRNVVYRVEQAFLIKRSDGLLIEHVHHEGAISRDTDAVSAMFTAIQDFIQHSFHEQTNENLTTAVLGELTLWAVHGPGAILVCVIRGVPPGGLRNDLSVILERIHLNYGDALASYDGGDEVVGLDIELERCLLLEHLDAEVSAAKPPYAAIFFLALVVAALAWWYGARIADNNQLARFRSVLEGTPGIVVTHLERDKGQVLVRGLRDPLSASPAELAPAVHLDAADLRLELEPYQSLDSPIIERRARRILRPPPGVGLRLNDGVLQASGSAPVAWKRRAQEIAAAIPGVDSVDTSAMNLGDEELLALARDALAAPETIQLSLIGDVVVATGQAPAAWIPRAQSNAAAVPELQRLDLDAVVVAERRELEELVKEIDGTEIFFTRNDVLRSGASGDLAALARRLVRIDELAAALGSALRITLVGFADGIGSEQINRQVKAARTGRVASQLREAGVSAATIVEREAPIAEDSRAIDPTRRKVVVSVGLDAAGGS